MTKDEAARIPVLVGVGQVSDHAAGAFPGPSVLDLMEAALRRAEADAGGSWLPAADFIGIVNQISSEIAPWPGKEPITPHLLARLGVQPPATMLSDEPSGDSPMLLLNHAANRIASGESKVALVVGAEALRTMANRKAEEARQRAAQPDAPRSNAPKSNAMRDLLDSMGVPELHGRYGLVSPTDIYPLFESATRAAWGQTLAEAQLESARMWSAFSKAAAANPGAWSHDVLEPEAILEVSAKNRMVSHPYTKLMVANSAVNQGAALIVTSLAEARARGVPEGRLVFIGAGAAAAEDDNILARDGYAGVPAMQASILGALERNNLQSADLDWVELYSCFPCVPKMARRILGWPLDRWPSVYGGLTFGGGPVANCMTHAAAAMVDKLRVSGRHGLIFANGGYATHTHSIILSRQAPQQPLHPQDFSVQAEADRLRGPVPPLDADYVGPGRIEAVSVPFGRDGTPSFGTVVARSPAGSRFVARVAKTDTVGLERLLSGRTEPVGSSGEAVAAADGYRYWSAT